VLVGSHAPELWAASSARLEPLGRSEDSPPATQSPADAHEIDRNTVAVVAEVEYVTAGPHTGGPLAAAAVGAAAMAVSAASAKTTADRRITPTELIPNRQLLRRNRWNVHSRRENGWKAGRW
jgi:hypothetical protein